MYRQWVQTVWYVKTASTYCNHVRGHSVPNKEEDIFGLSHIAQVAYIPPSNSGLCSVILELCGVVTCLVQGDLAINLGCHIDDGRLPSVLSKEVCTPISLRRPI